MASSLFPQLSRNARKHFRVGLVAVAAALIILALLQWQVSMITTAVFGLPLLLAVYLWQVDVRHDLRLRNLALAALTGLGLGVGWAVLTGPIVARAYTSALGGSLGTAEVFLCGVAIPASFALVLVAPAVVVRAVDRSPGESLDGFTIGALGATVADAAATATQLLPQLLMGLDADTPSVGGLLSQALVEGVAWPLTAIAAGGIFGIALWFRPAADTSRNYRGTIPVGLLLAVIFVVLMGLVDIAPIPLSPYIGLQLLVSVSAMLALRAVIADALLHETGEDASGADHLLCAECDHVVEWLSFCTDCGVALRAGSRTSRAARAVWTDPAVPVPPAASTEKSTYLNVLGSLTGGICAAVVAGVVLAKLVNPAPHPYVCPPDCGKPPLGHPVETNPRFSGDNGAFSVAYPAEGTAYKATFDPPGINGVQLKYLAGDTGTLILFGEPARNRTARQVVEQVLKARFPGATFAYEIPNASVGYQAGYGVISDVYPRDTSSTYTRQRVIVLAAVKHDYALITVAAGPYHEFSPSYGTGHPSGANLEVAMDMGKYVNSFRWNGDRYGRPS